MKIDLGSLAFNININGKVGGTPSWGTAIVYQTEDNKIKEEIANELLIGMIYKEIDCTSKNLSIPLGKGGHVYYGNEDYSTNGAPSMPHLAAKFEKTCINGLRIDKPFILLIVKDRYEAHNGRLQLKYSPKISWEGYTNKEFFDSAFKTLSLTSDAPFVCYAIEIINQDTLNFKCAYKNDAYTFKDTKEYYDFINQYSSNNGEDLNTRVNKTKHESFQKIFYGAPGTGKSHKIKAQLEGVSKENIFRTTFHPDSDYSTFVGAYKPTMEKPMDKVYTKGELISKLTEMKEGGVTYSPQKFGAKYWRSLKQLNLSDKKDILQACGMSDNYTVEFDKGVAVGEEYLACSNESRIIYSFVPQAFLNAYIQAYKKPEEKVYLIIEEINRGNCAQIFGDLFQLLDRDADGKSEYSIKADADLSAFLEEKLGEDNPGIKDGELCLPSNLYIYATMNTSDQSLFPIDSAFKRRWDWEYEPIKYKNIDWKIVIDGTEYSWVSFQRKVNEKIVAATSSEDKMLGDYFVNPSNGVITDKVLLNKILFYLWNDVCKDGEGDIFKVGETEDISFSELYGVNGTKMLKKMMSYLGVTGPDGNKVTIENDEENTELKSE